MIEKANATGGPADGDIWIFNDAHLGGTHLSDMRLVRPYFRDGKLFCWLASVGHWHDVGGAVPGNYNPGATDAFQEAFVLPPVRLARAGEIQQDVDRHPAAQHAAATIGARRSERAARRAGPGREAARRSASANTGTKRSAQRWMRSPTGRRR